MNPVECDETEVCRQRDLALRLAIQDFHRIILKFKLESYIDNVMYKRMKYSGLEKQSLLK